MDGTAAPSSTATLTPASLQTVRSLPASPRVKARNEKNGNLQQNIQASLQAGLGLLFKSSGQLNEDAKGKDREEAKARLLLPAPAGTTSSGKKIVIVPATPTAAPPTADAAGDSKKVVVEPPSPALSIRRPVAATGPASSPIAQHDGPRKHRNAAATTPTPHSPLALSRCPSSDGARTPPFRTPANGPAVNGSNGASAGVLKGGPAPAPAPHGDAFTPGSGHRFRSMRCLRDDGLAPSSWASMHLPAHDLAVPDRHLLSDAASVRSLASIGMGSTDGRKLTIRRVPTSPNELLHYSMHGARIHAEYDSSSRSSSCSSVSDGAPHRPTRRAHWANRAQFILACVGYCVGLGTVWRFPYLCYRSGGGVFLIPYFVTLLLLGIPMLYMEMSMGQFTRRGPIGALSMLCPLFKGAGVSSVIISFIMSTFYNVLIAYSLYYLFSAFRSELPWNSCGHRWNSEYCWSGRDAGKTLVNDSRPLGSRMPAEEFFENKVLHVSQGLDEPLSLRWELVACLLVAWVLVYFAVWKSVRSSGRMLYLTATLPFVLVLVFLGRALTLDGADEGLRYFFKPVWHKLGDAKVWVNALAQNFNSLGVALGSVVSLSSYNRYDNPILVDTLAVSFISVVSSMLVGLFAFATIGNIAHELETTVEDVISDGPGLVFVLYPQTMAKMPAAQFWSVCFFFMMLCLGLNTQFAMVEVVATSLQDGFSGWIKRHLNNHEVLVLVICGVSFFFGLPCVTRGGIYFFQLVDHYTASISIMYLAFFEVVGVAWLYGAGRLARNVRDMTGHMPGLYMRACWWVVSPATLLAVWVFFLIDYEPPTYDNGRYHYPWWAEALGWGIASLSLAAIPGMAVLAVVKAEGTTLKQKLLNATRPRVPESKQGSPRGGSPLNVKPGQGGVQAAAGVPEAATLLSHTTPPNVVNSEKV